MKYYFIFLMVAVVCYSVVVIFDGKDPQQPQKVDLPEEYKLITKDTPIQGYMRGDTLVIEFKHNYSNGNTNNTNLNSRRNR
jgi:hypothetical protein